MLWQVLEVVWAIGKVLLAHDLSLALGMLALVIQHLLMVARLVRLVVPRTRPVVVGRSSV